MLRYVFDEIATNPILQSISRCHWFTTQYYMAGILASQPSAVIRLSCGLVSTAVIYILQAYSAVIVAILLGIALLPVKHLWRIWLNMLQQSSRTEIKPQKNKTQPNCVHFLWALPLKSESSHDANFGISGGTGGCHNDNSPYHHWQQSWQHDNFRFSVIMMPECRRGRHSRLP